MKIVSLGWNYDLEPFAFIDLMIGENVLSLDQQKAAQSILISGRFVDGPVRVLLTGEDPSPSLGAVYYDGDSVEWSRVEAKQARMIRAGVTNGGFVGYFYRKL